MILEVKETCEDQCNLKIFMSGGKSDVSQVNIFNDQTPTSYGSSNTSLLKPVYTVAF